MCSLLESGKSSSFLSWKRNSSFGILFVFVLIDAIYSSFHSTFKVDNQEVTDPVDIANRFCSYFSSIGPNLAKEIHSSVSHRTFLSGHFCQSVFFDPVSPNELSEISLAFRSGKSAGYDRIPISIIKQSIQIIAEP